MFSDSFFIEQQLDLNHFRCNDASVIMIKDIKSNSMTLSPCNKAMISVKET